MRTDELKYPEWQHPLQQLILEFDETKAQEKAHQVESLILARIHKLRHEGDLSGELAALDDALRILRIVQRNRLGQEI